MQMFTEYTCVCLHGQLFAVNQLIGVTMIGVTGFFAAACECADPLVVREKDRSRKLLKAIG